MEPITINAAINIMRKACLDRMRYVTTLQESTHIRQVLDELICAQNMIASGINADSRAMYAINDNNLVCIARPNRTIERNIDSL